MDAKRTEHVPLKVASSLVYSELRQGVSAAASEDLDRALNDAALALSHVVEIYYEDDAGNVLPMSAEEISSGRFEQGAMAFISATGAAFENLSIRRIDLMHALEVLGKEKRAHSALRRVLAAMHEKARSPAPRD